MRSRQGVGWPVAASLTRTWTVCSWLTLKIQAEESHDLTRGGQVEHVSRGRKTEDLGEASPGYQRIEEPAGFLGPGLQVKHQFLLDHVAGQLPVRTALE